METPPWMTIAYEELGTKEIKGKEAHSRILEYFKEVGSIWIESDEVPWCGAFVGFCLKKTGCEIPDKSVRAKNWASYGMSLVSPLRGSIIVLYNKNRPKDSPFSGYHVGFFVKRENSAITLLGGNQNNKVCEKTYDLKKYQLKAACWPVKYYP